LYALRGEHWLAPQNSDEKLDEELQTKITTLEDDLKQMAPNMRAIERLEGVESRLKTTERDFEHARRAAKKAKDDFQEVKEQRFELFNKAFTHISEQIGPIYKDLTRSASLPMGGQAWVRFKTQMLCFLTFLDTWT